MAEFDPEKDYYRELGLEETASTDEIDRAFRKEARKRHPDHGGSEEEMKSLNEAHDVLSDPDARKAYDGQRNTSGPVYGSSMAFNPEASSAAGTLKIEVSDGDSAGLVIGAATCILIGLPLWLLVEMQWVFFLWPLRLLALSAVGLGVLMGNAALSSIHRRRKETGKALRPGEATAHRVLYWAIAIALAGLIFAFYAMRSGR